MNNTQHIPDIGLGLWKIPKEQTKETILSAYSNGYRHFDCASDYGNEAEAGEAFAELQNQENFKREELWITSKLWNTYHKKEHVKQALLKTLEDLQVEYLDLYMIHFPISLAFVDFQDTYPAGWLYPGTDKMKEDPVSIHETWAAMEELKKEGLVKNIGICNFNISLIRELKTQATLPPTHLQIELHPYLTQEKVLEYCKQEDIKITAFSPLGAESYYTLGMADESESLLEHPITKEIATELNCTAAQVLLKWGMQRDYSVVVKSSQEAHLIENLESQNITLNEEQMQKINALNTNRRFNDPGYFCEKGFNTFFPIYE